MRSEKPPESAGRSTSYPVQSTDSLFTDQARVLKDNAGLFTLYNKIDPEHSRATSAGRPRFHLSVEARCYLIWIRSTRELSPAVSRPQISLGHPLSAIFPGRGLQAHAMRTVSMQHETASKLRMQWRPIAFIALLLVLWESGVRRQASHLLPGPWGVVGGIIDLVRHGLL